MPGRGLSPAGALPMPRSDIEQGEQPNLEASLSHNSANARKQKRCYLTKQTRLVLARRPSDTQTCPVSATEEQQIHQHPPLHLRLQSKWLGW